MTGRDLAIAACVRAGGTNRLARILGVAPCTIARWKTGSRTVSTERAQALADYLGGEAPAPTPVLCGPNRPIYVWAANYWTIQRVALCLDLTREQLEQVLSGDEILTEAEEDVCRALVLEAQDLETQRLRGIPTPCWPDEVPAHDPWDQSHPEAP
jgi:transcriptional regulator with XRE-family HTH domain